MAAWLIALTGVIYAWVAVDLAWRGNTGLAIACAGYSASAVGLYLLARG